MEANHEPTTLPSPPKANHTATTSHRTTPPMWLLNIGASHHTTSNLKISILYNPIKDSTTLILDMFKHNTHMKLYYSLSIELFLACITNSTMIEFYLSSFCVKDLATGKPTPKTEQE